MLLAGICALAGLVLADTPQTGSSAIGTWSTNGASPTGRWVTPTHDAVIQISRCGQALCGKIVGMALAAGEPVPKDWQGQSQCGLTIIHVAPAANGDASWSGSVTDPRDGSSYHAMIRLDSSKNLLLRGYLGIPLFGQTQTWTKYAGSIAPKNCQLGG